MLLKAKKEAGQIGRNHPPRHRPGGRRLGDRPPEPLLLQAHDDTGLDRVDHARPPLGDSIRLYVQGGAILLLALALGAHVETGLLGALLMLLIGTLFGLVTFGVLTTNLALKTKDPALIQAIFPMSFLLIFLTTAFQTKGQIESGVLRAIVDANPAEHVLRPMRELMLSGYDWQGIGVAFLVIVGLGVIGLPLTIRNYRSVYR
jgi:ABC-type polysaccharide/polyol phosphate export permease